MTFYVSARVSLSRYVTPSAFYPFIGSFFFSLFDLFFRKTSLVLLAVFKIPHSF